MFKLNSSVAKVSHLTSYHTQIRVLFDVLALQLLLGTLVLNAFLLLLLLVLFVLQQIANQLRLRLRARHEQAQPQGQPQAGRHYCLTRRVAGKVKFLPWFSFAFELRFSVNLINARRGLN